MKEPLEILQQYWGYNQFRPLQSEIIDSVLTGHDTLALLPTGGGKSLCFQVPAMCKEGICIVVSPLIALMKDQVENLIKRNIKAAVVFSGMSFREVDTTIDNCVYGPYKFLYLSPERLMIDWVRERVAKMNVNLFAIDEAHCISQWGYDFRPPYLALAETRELHPTIPVMALTASATTDVQTDIMEKLNFKNQNVFRKSFERKNIHYVVQYEENKQERMLNLLHKVPGTSIIYVRNRRKTEQLAKFFQSKGIPSDYYHAGLTNKMRSVKQENWINSKTRLIVATNAFGMGIDKPDVRSVVHFDVPDNLESYYQEAGRAGRDEKQSFAVLLYNDADVSDMQKRVEVNFPPIEKIKLVYQALYNFLEVPVGSGSGAVYDFQIVDLCNTYNLKPFDVNIILKILELDGYITISDNVFLSSRLKFLLGGSDLYNFQVQQENIDGFIKVLLRSYEGLFDEYVSIYESEIAKRSNTTIEKVVQRLNYLNKLQVLDYIPFTDKPQLTLLRERLPIANVDISTETLANRKKRYVMRLSAIENYVTSHEHCRNMLLLKYFDEIKTERCGTCDYCRERNKLELKDKILDDLKGRVISLIEVTPLTVEEIEQKVFTVSKNKIVAVMRWLIETNVLKLIENKYYLK